MTGYHIRHDPERGWRVFYGRVSASPACWSYDEALGWLREVTGRDA